MIKKMITANGEEHGLVNILSNSCENNDFKYCKPEVKAKLEKEKIEDNRIEKYEYINRKGIHERLDKPYCRYAGDPIQCFHLIPGYTYDLPVGFAKEVNEKTLIKRAGLVSIGGENATQDGAPLAKDIQDWEHRLIKVS